MLILNRRDGKSETTLSEFAAGTLIKIAENGTLVDFYVAKHNYEPGLNWNGRTLVVRKDIYDNRAWARSDVNAYAISAIDSWLDNTYKNLLDADIRSLIGTTTIRYTPGNLNNRVDTLKRSVFLLSATELGKSENWFNVEGRALPIASTLQVAYRNGSATTQWTRSPNMYYANLAVGLNFNGYANSQDVHYTAYGSRPTFTLPSTTPINPDTMEVIA